MPPFIAVTPATELIGFPLKSQSMFMGRSPDDTKQFTDTESSKFAGVSPKVNSTIFGGTRKIRRVTEVPSIIGLSVQNS